MAVWCDLILSFGVISNTYIVMAIWYEPGSELVDWLLNGWAIGDDLLALVLEVNDEDNCLFLWDV